MTEDPVADMLARINNGAAANKLSVAVPHTNLLANTAEVLKTDGFIDDYEVDEGGPQGTLEVELAYTESGEPKIRHTRRISRPARRRYVGHDEIPDVRGDYGTVVLSTPKGVMSGEKARQQHVGGELLFEIW